MGGQKLAYSPFVLAVVFRAGLFSFFSAKLGPVWPKPAPDRAGAGRSPPGMETGHTGLSGGNQGACVVLWDGWLRRVPPVPEGTQGTQNSARGGVGGICVTCWEIHRDARGESVGHFSSRVTQNAGELDLQHTKYRILFTVTCPPCTLLMGPEQERRSQQRGSQPAPNFQRHLRHWW